ncbi:MAG TPA: aspartyl-phosphate phosphatase Spo0E family protein [Bacilli bacterium]|nr:aspartyl-phosphate phosphatase Spo0E family protein [Bacilli bacterium]
MEELVLEKRIELLRRQMILMAESTGDLGHGYVIAISQQLDDFLVRLQRLRMQRRRRQNARRFFLIR